MKYFVPFILLVLTGCSQFTENHTNFQDTLLPEPAPEEVVQVQVSNPKVASSLERLDKFLQGQTGLLFLFLIFQAIQLWYFSKTGEESETIKKASDGIYNKMGFVHRLLYKYIRYKYYKGHPDKPELPKKDG